jgi:PAS domain-containing protein
MSLKQPNTERAPDAGSAATAKAAEHALVQHKHVLETLLESTADFIYMKDHEGRYVFVNPAAAESVGKRIQERPGTMDGPRNRQQIWRQHPRTQPDKRRIFMDMR